MKAFITNNKYLRTALTALFWLALWQVLCVIVNQELFLASPLAVLKSLWRLSGTGEFWLSALNSMTKILLGFLLALVLGTALGAAAAFFTWARTLLGPLLSMIKSTPVASFTILALLWVKTPYISVFISFLMCLPLMYFSALDGLLSADKKLLEMARVFRVSRARKAAYIYAGAAMPFLASSASTALGFAWKSGVAAEVIGLQSRSVGYHLYQSKILLETADTFAWTAVIILLSLGMERLFKMILQKYGMGGPGFGL